MSWLQNKKPSAAERRAELARSHATDVTNLRKANWEQKSEQLMVKREVDRRMKKANQEHEKALLLRRQKLAALLQSEHEAYTAEITAGIETDDQRRERMIAEARRLQREREQRRRDEVAEIQEQQFRESLDGFRTRKSHAIRLQCAQERISQLEEKKAAEEQQKVEAERIHEAYLETGERMRQREVREAEIARQKNAEVVDMIAEQVALKKRFQEQEDEEEAVAVQEWRLRLKQMDVEEQRKEQAKMNQRIQMDHEVAEQNRSRLGRYAALEAEERARDMQLLQQALQKEREDKAREAAAKAAAAEENAGFKEFLQLQMQKEAEDHSALNKILKEENEKAWAKRESQWNAEAAARNRLQAEVAKSRTMQLEHRVYNRREEEVAKKEEIARLRRLHEEGLRDDMRKRELREAELAKYRQQLSAQVTQREDSANAAYEEEVREKVALKAQFEAFDKKVEQVFQSDYKPPSNYRRKKIEWYS